MCPAWHHLQVSCLHHSPSAMFVVCLDHIHSVSLPAPIRFMLSVYAGRSCMRRRRHPKHSENQSNNWRILHNWRLKKKPMQALDAGERLARRQMLQGHCYYYGRKHTFHNSNRSKLTHNKSPIRSLVYHSLWPNNPQKGSLTAYSGLLTLTHMMLEHNNSVLVKKFGSRHVVTKYNTFPTTIFFFLGNVNSAGLTWGCGALGRRSVLHAHVRGTRQG